MTAFQKMAVRSYRFLAIVILSGVLLSALGWFGVTGLFQFSQSWAAPVLISKTHARIMALTADVFRTKQAADDLTVKTGALREELAVLETQEVALVELIARYGKAVKEQTTADRAMAGRLSALRSTKNADDAKALSIVKTNTVLASSIDRELAAGLITAEAATRQRAQLINAELNATNARLSTAALDRQVSELSGAAATLNGAQSNSVPALESLARFSQFQRELSEVQLKMSRNRKELANKTREQAELVTILGTLEKTPYFRASMAAKPMPFAFVPYTNEDAAKLGEPVYSCYLRVIFCSKVGEITAVYSDEEKLRHPTNNEDIRGFLVELRLTEDLAGKDKVLFIGGGPLFL